MFKQCTVPSGETIAIGDAVCVIGFDTANNRPTVKRATRDNLAASKTVFGVAEDNAVFEDVAAGGSVFVLVAGEVAENAITSLGAGDSRIIATDVNNATAAKQCRLIRIDHPDGSEYVVGTCDENGNLVVQPRASREASTLHVFNVRSYGAFGDGAADDLAAITNAVSAIAVSGGTLFFPSGTYSVTSDLTIPPHVQVMFEEGAILAPAGAAVTIHGPVTCHPAQQVFGGTGVNKLITQVGPGPAATVSGSPFGNYSVVLTIHTPGGLPAPLGTATFTYTLNGGFASFPELLTAASVVLPMTGLTIAFGASPPDFADGTTYTWESQAPITLSPAAFDRFNIRNFGAIPDYDPDPLAPPPTDNLPFFNAALAALAASGNRSAALVVDGHFFLSDTLVLAQTVVLEGTAMNEPPPFAPSRSRPGTMLVFPGNTDGIRVRSAALEDNPTGSAEKTTLRNLTIFCKDAIDPNGNNTGNGLSTRVPVYVENVNIQNFAGDGINVYGNILNGFEGNASNCNFINCIVGGCGRDGFHIEGGDATGCTLLTCTAVVNRRYGFFDSTRGNTYITCHAEANGAKGLQPPIGGDGVPAEDGGHGAEWRTEGSVNSSCLVSCYAEGPHRNELLGQVMVIGGAIGKSNLTESSTCFVLEKGVASRSPFAYLNDCGPVATRIELGQQEGADPPPPASPILHGGVLNFVLPSLGDYNLLRYDETLGWWGLDNSSPGGRTSFRFPTTISRPRRTAPLFSQGIFYGTPGLLGEAEASKKLTNHIAGVSEPTPLTTGGTWEVGDVVWNSLPVPGGPIGWICTTAGTEDAALVGVTGTVDAVDGTKVTLNVLPESLAKWQYITIAGVADVYQIVNDPGHPAPDPDLTLRINRAAPIGAAGAIDFSRTKFSTFGSVRGTVTVDVTVTTALDASSETIKLIGSLAADTTITVPSQDGWSARFLDLTTRNGHALKVNSATSPGMADYALTNGQTQRLYIEYDTSVPEYNIRPEGPSA
jgi:hypothetical protein